MTRFSTLETALKAVVSRAIDARVASSISLAVSFGDDPAIIIHDGHTQGAETGARSVYDLASITKIIGTTMTLAHAVKRSDFSLDDVLFPQWPHATIAAILAHRSGLPAHLRFYETLKLPHRAFASNRVAIFNKLFTVAAHESRDARLYSDLGFMALGHHLEQRYNKSLFEIFESRWRDASLDCSFRWYPSQPLTHHSDEPHLAPSGVCRARKRLVVGQVHDPNCYFMGGLEGHTGLFSTLADVDAFGRYLLRAFITPKNRAEDILQKMALRGIGFDKPTSTGTTRYFSDYAFGHFGYTGTALWVDPRWHGGRGVVVSLLTNRVNCSERPEGIFWLRLAINRLLSRMPF